MKYYKNCEGCGEKIQTTDINEKGFSPKEDSLFCQRCFRKEHYGEGENNLEEFNPHYYLTNISEAKDEVIMVIDALNPQDTVIKNINKYIKPSKLTLVVNKVDVFPKSIPDETIIEWIDNLTMDIDLEFKNIVLLSTYNKKNIDALANYIESSENSFSIIGYSNVGKSSLIKALFAAKGEIVNNLVSRTIGTTTKPIELDFFGTKVTDYPGFILETSMHNQLTQDQLKIMLPEKEINVVNYQLNEGQIVSIGDLVHFETTKQEENLGYQFMFSNEAEYHRGKKENKDLSEFEKIEINPLQGAGRQDIIISGIGIITFQNKGQKLTVHLPKGVSVSVVKSIFK